MKYNKYNIIIQILILKYNCGPEKIPGLSRNSGHKVINYNALTKTLRSTLFL